MKICDFCFDTNCNSNNNTERSLHGSQLELDSHILSGNQSVLMSVSKIFHHLRSIATSNSNVINNGNTTYNSNNNKEQNEK